MIARLRAHRARQQANADLFDMTHDIALTEAARRGAREVAYRHRLDSVSTEVLLQPIYSMAEQERGAVA